MQDSRPLLIATDFPRVKRNTLEILQVNLGYKCNLSCVHCHVNAGPQRTEMMARETIDDVLDFMASQKIKVLDLTGGAPEMNPHFCYLVEAARAMGVEVIDRCNLTILLQPDYQHLAGFLAANRVTITASLPCYLEENVEQQRGKGVYEDSIVALRQLNALGYGRKPELVLNLVFNPVGANLPPPQADLEADYKRELQQRYGVVFDNLFTLTNMPISRFGAVLLSSGQFEDYMDLLKGSFNAANLDTVMCRSLASVDWQGYVYDCDFNQMLGMPLGAAPRGQHLRELLDRRFTDREVAVGEHCYGCTAGQGSSCGGALGESG